MLYDRQVLRIMVQYERTDNLILYRGAENMAAQSDDSKNPSTKSGKKKAETVLLTPAELRRLAGGASNPNPNPISKPGPADVKKGG
jgi:hypothetical protein